MVYNHLIKKTILHAPILKISPDGLDSPFSNISGDMYPGVPAITSDFLKICIKILIVVHV